MTSRRVFLASAAAASLGGCGHLSDWWRGRTHEAGPLIDGHCHTFNIKDLSAVRFLSWVVLKHYPKQPEPRRQTLTKSLRLAPEDPDWIDRLMAALLAAVGAGAAPRAVDELAALEGRSLAPLTRITPAQTRAQTAAALEAMMISEPSDKSRDDGPAMLKALVLQAAGQPAERAAAPLTPAESRRLVARALSPRASAPLSIGGVDVYLPGLIDFISELKQPRAQLVDDLTALHRGARQEPQLLAPAMVDFGRWLRDDPGPGSTFVDQAKVWRAIGKRAVGPAVHGYVAFCPLRKVLHRRGRFGPGKIETACDADPLEVVRAALKEQGFLGVKLYPPMGFRAAGNAMRSRNDHPMPTDILEDVFGRKLNEEEIDARIAELGRELDAALEELYGVCAELGAPIMAHGGNSIDAACHMGELADPFYWKPVLDRKNGPPVMLAHFGGFNYRSADPATPGGKAMLGGRCRASDAKAALPQTWEAWLGRYVTANPGQPVFADLSMLTEALYSGQADQALANLKWLDSQYPLMKDHLVFGTDWVMLAQKKKASDYSWSVRELVKEAFGAAHVDRIMRTNFLRYAGLAPQGATIERLAKAYDGDARLTARLRLAATA